MAKIVSLSRVRKTRERVKKRAQADENAVKFGKSKPEKALESARRAKAARELDLHQREP